MRSSRLMQINHMRNRRIRTLRLQSNCPCYRNYKSFAEYVPKWESSDGSMQNKKSTPMPKPQPAPKLVLAVAVIYMAVISERVWKSKVSIVNTVKVSFHKIQFRFTICVPEFMNHSCLIRMDLVRAFYLLC